MMSEISPKSISNLQQARLLQSAQILVAKKGLDAIKQQGEAVIQLMETATELARQSGSPPTSPPVSPVPPVIRGIDLSA